MSNYTRRQFLRTTAATALGAGILGCGNTLAAHAASGAAGKAVTLSYTNRWGKGNDTHYAGMNYLFSTFKAKQPQVTIREIVLPAGPDVQKDLADCQSGGCPDMMNDMTGTFWDDGYLLDLTPYLNADPAWKASLDQGALAFNTTDGHTWGLCDELSPMNVVWNTQLLEKAGVSSLPKTWDAFLTTCEKLKRSGTTPTTWIGLYGGGHMFHNLVAGQPGGLQALAHNNFQAPQILEAFNVLKMFVDNKWIAPDEVQLSYGQGLARFQAGQAAFYINGMWTLKNDITGTGISPSLRNHVAFSPLPGIKGGLVVENKVATVLGLAAALKSNPDKLNAAIAFIKYFFSEPLAARWIPLTWSPMGVTVPLKSIPSLEALPKAWLVARDQATTVFALPATRAMQEQQWADTNTALQTLLLGRSAQAAQAAYVQYLAKYMKA